MGDAVGVQGCGGGDCVGSFKTDGMVVVPCSNNKLAEMAHGLGRI